MFLSPRRIDGYATNHDLSGSPRDLRGPWPEVKFWHYFFLGEHAYISTYLDKRSTMTSKLFRQLSSIKSYLRRSYFCKNVYFGVSWPLEPNASKKGHFWRHIIERTAQELIDCIFPRLPTYNSFWNNRIFPKKYGISLTLTLGDLWWPQYWPDWKLTDAVSEWFWTSFRTPFPVSCYNA